MKPSERRAVYAVLELVTPPGPARVLAVLMAEGDVRSQGALAAKLKMAEGKASEAVAWLSSRGFVQVEAQERPGGGRGPNVVRVTPEGAHRLALALRPYASALRVVTELVKE